MEAKRIDQAPVTQRGKRLAHGLMKQDAVFPSLRVMDIPRFGRDIQISAQSEGFSGVTLSVKKVPDTAQPSALIRKLLTSDHLSIRNVETQDMDTCNVDGQEASFGVFGVTSEAAHDLTRLRARQDSDTVIGLLSTNGHAVAGLLKLATRKSLVRDFCFLQTNDFGQLPAGEPFQHPLFAHPNRIDVPSGNTH